MGGVASHAGLFGTALQVAEAGRRWISGDVPLATEAFTSRGPGTHALGWDTPNPDGTSTSGGEPPPDAVGHTGYTGTSIWMSPSRGRVAVLLTNRVAYTLDIVPIRGLRRAFHQAAWSLGDSDVAAR
jgi:CubicO group peptidase (beta-lactamase class C family)